MISLKLFLVLLALVIPTCSFGQVPSLDAINTRITANPNDPEPYFEKAQLLIQQATFDGKKNRIIVSPECIDSYNKYLALAPNGEHAAAVRKILATGIAPSGPPRSIAPSTSGTFSSSATVATLPPLEWRPSVAEDNKPATWEDTEAFLVTTLATRSDGYTAISDVRCQLVLRRSDTPTLVLEIGHVDPLTIGVSGNTLYASGTDNGVFAHRCPTAVASCGSASTPISDPLRLELRDVETAKRFARALLHAALLCGGTKAVSPF